MSHSSKEIYERIVFAEPTECALLHRINIFAINCSQKNIYLAVFQEKQKTKHICGFKCLNRPTKKCTAYPSLVQNACHET